MRLVVAVVVFGLLAAPHWPGTVDDVYITIAYARHWADSGALEWSTGERVEGYSNFLLVAILAIAARLGLDLDIMAQVVAVGGAVAVLALLHARLTAGFAGTVALWAVASWAPLNRWGVIGLETTLYAALLAIGWSLLFGAQWGLGVALVGAASLTRPEGGLLFVAALATAARRRSTPRDQMLAAATVSAVVAYHAARYAWFGALTPTPALIKLVGFTTFGAAQLLGDLTTAARIMVATAASARLRSRDVAWVALPLVVHASTLVIASGDWMSFGRLLLPGVVATVAAYATLGTPTRPSISVGVLAALATIVCSCLESRGYGRFDVRLRPASAIANVVHHLDHGLDTPVAEDVAWASNNVPAGGVVAAVDVGMLGDIPGLNVLDIRGLTHRPAAVAAQHGTSEAWLRSLLSSERERPEFLRLANWDGAAHPRYPDWLLEGYTLRADLLYGEGSVRWYSTTQRLPSASTRAERWAELMRRHPSQPFIRWHAALSAAADGRLDDATRIATEGTRRWPAMAEFQDAPSSLSFVQGTRAVVWDSGRGVRAECGDTVITRALRHGERAVIATSPAVTIRVQDPCGSQSAELVECGGTRQVQVSLTCEEPGAGSVHVRLVY